MHKSDEQPKRFAIVGGGILGMTTALRLAQAGHHVTIMESADRLGGLADAWRIGDIQWDRHYHVTLLSDAALRRILDELGLDEHMCWVETKTGCFADGQLHSISNSWEFLMFPGLPLLAKLRLALTIVVASRIRRWQRLEHVLVADWLRRWSGKTAFERFWRPLLRSKLGENYRQTSAAFMWATISRLYAARRAGLKKEMLGYLPGGYARTLAVFEDRLRELGVVIQLAQPVDAVESVGGHVEITSGEQTWEFDRVIVTTPSRIVPSMVPQLTSDEQARHNGIEYQGIVCASVLLKKPLADYYVTNITDDVVPFTGVIEMSALVDRSHFGGHSLVYLPFYVPENDDLFDATDEQIREQSLGGLERMYGHFSRDDVVAFRVSRVRQVMAIPTLGYSEHLPPIKTSVPGVYVVNSAQIVNGTLNVHETIALAERTVNETIVTNLIDPPETTELTHVEAIC